MGTRNLTMVIYQEKTRVAQYGQWDGRPSGQGSTILDFLAQNKLEAFKEKLLKTKFIDAANQKEIDSFLTSIGSKNGWLNMEQSALFAAKYPFISRDNGAGILQMILDSSEEEIWLNDSTEFAADSLFCEYAYVLDLDKNVLEVYRGFTTTPLSKKQRFYFLTEIQKREGDKYFPIKLAKSYSLDNLPTVEQMVSDIKKRRLK